MRKRPEASAPGRFHFIGAADADRVAADGRS